MLDCTVSVPAAAQRDFSAVQVTATALGGTVHMLEGAGGNVAASVGADGVLMVDSQFPEMRERLLATPLPKRFELDADHHRLFINFEGLGIDTAADIADIEALVSALLEPVVRRDEDRVTVVVNYDNFSILPTLIDDYSAMVKRLAARFYAQVTRYGTGGFLKAKLEAK